MHRICNAKVNSGGTFSILYDDSSNSICARSESHLDYRSHFIGMTTIAQFYNPHNGVANRSTFRSASTHVDFKFALKNLLKVGL